MRPKYLILIIASLLLSNLGCNSDEPVTQQGESENIEQDSTDSQVNDTLTMIVLPCANGYEYTMHNYDFTPIVETELNKFENIKVKPFPSKTLMGVNYFVFDKKYCPPIIEKVDVDFLILTHFYEPYSERHMELDPETNRLVNNRDWGYRLKVVNTSTLEEIKSISVHNLESYNQIEEHIKENIETLKADIEKLK